MSYCSRSRRRPFTVLNFKSWAYSLIYGHFSPTFVLLMRRNGYLWTSGVNLDTAVRFADPDFLLECNISAIWRRFPLISHFICRMSAIFLLSVCLTYWPKSIPHASTPTSIIPTKFKARTPILSWVMSDNVSHWLPLKVRTRPLLQLDDG